MIINLMEGNAIPTNTLISSIKSFNSDGKQHGTIKALLKNFILPETDMAIKENQNNSKQYIYTIPAKPPVPTMAERMKSINDAKQAFLNSTVSSPAPPASYDTKKDKHTVHYAQIAITESDDTRSTGGGRGLKLHIDRNNKEYSTPVHLSPSIKKTMEQQQRKVSFKIKNASTSHKRPPLAKTMTIPSSKVAELTKKFNNLQMDNHTGSPKQTKLVKTLEDLQSGSRCSASNSSTPSSTLSSSPNIKIVLRHRRGSKKKSNRKRCSSMDSVDNLLIADGSSKIRVIRSKSDGTKMPKTPKKRLKYQDSSEQPSGSDSVDGSPIKTKEPESTKDKAPVESNVVKNVIKKFECEITAQTNSNNTLKRQPDKTKSTTPLKEKPKVPEKKSSLVLTKNLVVKDGIPKIKTIKPTNNVISDVQKPNTVTGINSEVLKRKEPIYDRKKYRTNYMHSEKLPLKLPLKVVEIIPEDIHENSAVTVTVNNETSEEARVGNTVTSEDEKCYQDINPPITPNESFLWRRKSSTQIYSDTDKSASDSSYSFVSVSMNGTTISCSDDPQEVSVIQESQSETDESQVSITMIEQHSEPNMDFESNLVEACNKEIIVGFTSKPKNEEAEDYYEPLEPRDEENIIVIPVKSVDRSSKINCPLPDIPKEDKETSDETSDKENIYQCLLEMRSHPEGDESSLHNYELCDNELEERTRGDGDSDDGYEYCKSPVKPYCLTSSSGIQIAEDYQPFSKDNNKNYAISKSVSGGSTVSYEKIGSERIYEKIPSRQPKSKDSSPTYSSRHSFISDYTGYNDSENIYDTIKHGDGISLSHCYESIPNSPSMVKLRNNLKKQLASNVQKRLSFDTVSNISQSTMSSEQKTNSLYGQRSMISYNGQEIAFQVPSSETSVSDRSDRSDDWVDVSDEEKNEQKIIIVRERSRGRKSPISWSQKVRHQWQKSPKPNSNDKECDSSDSGHLYESLEPAPAQQLAHAQPPLPLEEDFDSFDSDSDDDDHDKSTYAPAAPTLPASRLPNPPSSGQYTLTKIASAAQRKMRQIKRNLTKRYSVAMDGKPFTKTANNQSTNIYEASKKKSPIYANCEKSEPVYSNITFSDSRPVVNKTEIPLAKVYGSLKEELKTVISDKRVSNGDVPPPLPDKPPPEKPVTPTSETSKKDSGTLSRKAYFSFKSRFRRATSLAVDMNSDVPSALKITNSTFYLTDSMDGDSGFSNCSDSGQPGSTETLSPASAARRRDELKRLLPTLSRKDKSPRARTSWYAECGQSADTTPNTSNTSWYAEAGLYQAGNISSSSGASSGSHPASPLPHSLFTHEPLYQFYNAAKVESVCRETGDSDSDAYEAGSQRSSPAAHEAAPARPSAMALVAPRGPSRTLWCEVPEVLNSTVLSSLAPAQKRLQEAKFELLTSEASYLNSLNVLEANFIAHPAFRDPHVMPRHEWDTLFATILPVRKCSQLLMNELEKCWQDNILLQGICDIVRQHAEQHFGVYVKYCENQALMVKALQRLQGKTAFVNALRKLENHPSCQSLSLHSFLMLPMQRVTRLPLLMDAVLKNLNSEDLEYHACARALVTLNNYVSQCNEGARNTERIEEMFRLSKIIEFPPNIRDPPSLGPAISRRDRRPVRWLVRSGEMTQLIWKTDELKLTFGKKFHKVPLHLFLFNDLLVITKKKSEDQFVCVDHCARSLLEVCASEAGAASAKHALLVTLLDNHEGRTLEMLMSCPSETEWSRWSEALVPPAAGAEGEAVYAGWDCPQVAALYAYLPAQPDELPLAEGDVVNVTRKTSEGWYYGERTRDGEAGWFPGAYTAEIASPHVRARNLRQRYRLLALSGTYLGQKKRNA
ncbi:rho guanine nucleotide exchange factor 5 isoform X1 [Trichoplusia ni]|uniref:Rho guanine nucleotide exchange factor 5 isoform X1 n=1 Tax=Trichoplusia ni TaxID=7111 RepID=A0A7E5WPF9_TRINI|nr:rho guanine nucleotide exchange factor 5 isoform X1 [Trichoplusia ni]XP_026742655.1 rho guanine nucleotide exchange factor 5 isoform X1 [Trichoplusia ni]XP_026742656.1 rho guanine nucleotide exchange factor 5 isoform X1 [Trichoplusia ni]